MPLPGFDVLCPMCPNPRCGILIRNRSLYTYKGPGPYLGSQFLSCSRCNNQLIYTGTVLQPYIAKGYEDKK